jgi:hypothetical protein
MSPLQRHRRTLPTHPGWLLVGVAGLLLLAAGLAGFFQSATAASSHLPASTPSVISVNSVAFSYTPTPFRPLPPTTTPLPTATSTPTPTPEFRHFARRMDASMDGQVSIHIQPPEAVNGGREINISFSPASDCPFGSGTACISRHRNGQVILLTVHSGVGGQGEAFRWAVEGSGINSAIFPLARIHENLFSLEGAPVTLEMGADSHDGLELAGVARVPPSALDDYFRLPFDEALALAAQSNPALARALESGDGLLIFEICGWVVPGEPSSHGVSNTSASIYLGFIRDR